MSAGCKHCFTSPRQFAGSLGKLLANVRYTGDLLFSNNQITTSYACSVTDNVAPDIEDKEQSQCIRVLIISRFLDLVFQENLRKWHETYVYGVSARFLDFPKMLKSRNHENVS